MTTLFRGKREEGHIQIFVHMRHNALDAKDFLEFGKSNRIPQPNRIPKIVIYIKIQFRVLLQAICEDELS